MIKVMIVKESTGEVLNKILPCEGEAFEELITWGGFPCVRFKDVTSKFNSSVYCCSCNDEDYEDLTYIVTEEAFTFGYPQHV